MRRSAWVAVAAVAMAALPASLHGRQLEERVWGATVRAGPLVYGEASAISPGAALSLEGLYRVNSRLGLGAMLDFVDTKSDGRFFVAAIDFGPDSVRVFEVGQNLSVMHYALVGSYEIMPESRFRPYAAAGVGSYMIYGSPQSNAAAKRLTGPLLHAGVGVAYPFGNAMAVQVEARDLIYLSFDRDELNPIRPDHRNLRPGTTEPRFPGAEHDLPGKSSTSHGFRLTVGFNYLPGITR